MSLILDRTIYGLLCMDSHVYHKARNAIHGIKWLACKVINWLCIQLSPSLEIGIYPVCQLSMFNWWLIVMWCFRMKMLVKVFLVLLLLIMQPVPGMIFTLNYLIVIVASCDNNMWHGRSVVRVSGPRYPGASPWSTLSAWWSWTGFTPGCTANGGKLARRRYDRIAIAVDGMSTMQMQSALTDWVHHTRQSGRPASMLLTVVTLQLVYY